ncbi:MAG: TetR/AcrR family transcriptional regulator [Methylobacteriaceae bacterium]|nr:TetR/AcrR family transcriptional regulator [Methylobacteriaceae bacterium]
MEKGAGTREKTLAAAAKLFREHGYEGTALHDILDAAKTPRGSLYFHFPRGKEEIGEAALTLAANAVRDAIAGAAATSKNGETFLIRIARGMAADLERSDYKQGCPIATTALETAARSQALGATARTAFQGWEEEIKAGLEKFGFSTRDADFIATAALSQLEGALLLARTYRNLEPMRRAENALKVLLSAGKPK